MFLTAKICKASKNSSRVAPFCRFQALQESQLLVTGGPKSICEGIQEHHLKTCPASCSFDLIYIYIYIYIFFKKQKSVLSEEMQREKYVTCFLCHFLTQNISYYKRSRCLDLSQYCGTFVSPAFKNNEHPKEPIEAAK